MSSRSLPESDGIPAASASPSASDEIDPSSAWRTRASIASRRGRRRPVAMRVLLAFGALALLLTTALRVRNASRRAAAHVRRGEQGEPLRVGGLTYRVLAARLERDRVRVDLVRSNATQAFFSVQSARVTLRLADGRRFAPDTITLNECHGGDECATLDPGESRRDEFVFLLPRESQALAVPTAPRAAIEVVAGATEAGPRRGEIRLRLH